MVLFLLKNMACKVLIDVKCKVSTFFHVQAFTLCDKNVNMTLHMADDPLHSVHRRVFRTRNSPSHLPVRNIPRLLPSRAGRILPPPRLPSRSSRQAGPFLFWCCPSAARLLPVCCPSAARLPCPAFSDCRPYVKA